MILEKYLSFNGDTMFDDRRLEDRLSVSKGGTICIHTRRKILDHTPGVHFRSCFIIERPIDTSRARIIFPLDAPRGLSRSEIGRKHENYQIFNFSRYRPPISMALAVADYHYFHYHRHKHRDLSDIPNIEIIFFFFFYCDPRFYRRICWTNWSVAPLNDA